MLSFQKTFLFAFLVGGLTILLGASDAMAQGRGGRGGGRGFGPPGGFGGRGGGGIAGLLRRDDVRKELELTDEQMQDLEEVQSSGFEGMRELFQEMRDEGLSREEMREKMMEVREEREAESKKDLEEILLPFQYKRLEQLSNQSAMRGNNARGLLDGPIAEKLKITDEQKEAMKSKAEKLQKELDEKVQKLRDKMREELLDELSSSQRKQFEEMMGESFTFQDQERNRDRGGRDRGGRDRGGRRGDRPERDSDV